MLFRKLVLLGGACTLLLAYHGGGDAANLLI